MTTPGSTDTIAAVATPPGRGGIGIIRFSGPKCREIAKKMLGKCPSPRRAMLARFCDAQQRVLDEGIALFFPGPASYTGEDVLELQGHGGPMVLDAVLTRALNLGARIARPGEFSERAFLNNKLDLAQAEAVADLIDAGSHQAAAAALRSLQGDFSNQVQALTDALVRLRVYVEAAIDFADEEIDYLADVQVLVQVEQLQNQLRQLLNKAQSGAVLREGLRVVIAGQPNVGKSSLLNRLAGRDAAIVTDIAGTTRDLLHEQITLDGLPLHIIDTAGLRDTQDPVEVEGVRRARAELKHADCVLLLVDDNIGVTSVEEEILANLPPTLGVTLLLNKCDISGNPPGEYPGGGETAQSTYRLSAATGAGVEALITHLQKIAGYQAQEGGQFIARRRHLLALQDAASALDKGHVQLAEYAAGELLAEELNMAQQALSTITGKFTSEDLLGEIFSSFCIGK